MLEQHPVPQNVTTFQFRLIGDMTIKQFGYLAGGIILAYIAYKLPLPFFFSWPLAALFGLGGVGFAFIPIEERPMDVWFLSFIKSIYSPTLFIWQREEPKPAVASIPATSAVVTTKKSQLLPDFSFLSILIPKPHKKNNLPGNNLPKTETAITSAFSPTNFLHALMVKPPKRQLPQQKETPLSMPHVPYATVLASAPIPTVSQPNPIPEEVPKEESQQIPSIPQATPTQPESFTPPPIQHPQQEPDQENDRMKELEKKLEAALNDRKHMEEELLSIKQLLLSQQPKDIRPLDPVMDEKKTQPPQPTYSGRSNIIEGIVRLNTGELLHNILVTVKDREDIPIRALKTNKTGQFVSPTPLKNGVYTIEVEDPKGSLVFNPITVTLTGDVVPPFTVIAITKQEIERKKLEEALFGKKTE